MMTDDHQTLVEPGTDGDTVRQTQEFLFFPESSQLLPAQAPAERGVDPARPSPALPPPFDPTTESWLHRLEGVVGQVVDGRYTVLSLLGIGGMGAVYEVEHREIGRRMAMKILHSALVDHAVTVTRFREEARTAMRINHPNVVEVTDAGITEDGRAYFVMELLRGVILADVMDQAQGMSTARALHITLQICRALQVAHSAGIIHRDLKPGNIILTQPQGHPDFVKIFDFGIAKQMMSPGTRPPLTFPGVAMGTPCYMAPEQVLGQKVDYTIDIYAAGTMLFEMLTGRLPYEGETVMKLLHRKISTPPLSPRTFLPELSEALEQVILRALALQPGDRYQNMSELADALEEVARAELSVPDTWEDETDPRAMEPTRKIQVEEPTLVVSRNKLLLRSRPRVTERDESEGPERTTWIQEVISGKGRRSCLARRLLFGLLCGGVALAVSPAPRRTGEGQTGASSAREPAAAVTPLHAGAGHAAQAGQLQGASPQVHTGPELASTDQERSGSPSLPARTRVDALMEWARYAAQAGRLAQPQGDNVVDLLERVEHLAPKNPEAAALRRQLCASLAGRASRAIKDRRYGEVTSMIHAWSKLDPGDPRLGLSVLQLNLHQGRDALDRGDLAGALAFVQEAQGMVQLDPRVDELMGDVHLARGQRVQARRYYQRALEIAAPEARQRLRRKIRGSHRRRTRGRHHGR